MLNKNKGLNPRLVTSTILNQEKPVKKVNFKKMIKKTNNLENTETKKEEKKVHFEEKKPQANKKLLMAFFQQN